MGTLIITGTGAQTVPSDWNNANNKIEVIGPGGNGSAGTTASSGGSGGGGAYAIVTNVALTRGASLSFSWTAGGSGADAWCVSSGTVLAKAGANGGVGSVAALGAGGAAASCVPSAGAFSGGSGAAGVTTTNSSGAGGGGSAGKNGIGKAGAAGVGSTTAQRGGGGGGGSDGGTSTAGSAPSTTTGGAGGAGTGGTGGGSTGGGTGTVGGGGGGGNGTGGNGGPSGVDTTFTTNGVAGGGGGGGSGASTTIGKGGNAGGPGGGGGGSGKTSAGTGVAGSGGDSLIVLTWTPYVTPQYTATGGATTGGAATTSPPPPPQHWSITDHYVSGISISGTLNDTITRVNDSTANQRVGRATRSDNSGKFYFECVVTFGTRVGTGMFIGFAPSTLSLQNYIGQTADSIGLRSDQAICNGAGVGTTGYVTGNRLGIAIDAAAKKIWWRINGGVWCAGGIGGDPAANTGGVTWTSAAAQYPAFSSDLNSDTVTCNFGDTAFVDTIPSGFSRYNSLPSDNATPLLFNSVNTLLRM